MTVVVEAIYRLIGTMVELPEDERTPELRVDKIFSAFDIVRIARDSLVLESWG